MINFYAEFLTFIVLLTSSLTDHPDLQGFEDIPAHELIGYTEKMLLRQ